MVADEVRALASRTQQSTQEIHDMNGQIASASEEQTAVFEEISLSMTQIAQAVDTVADDAQSGAHTARSLTELGDRLGGLVKQFRT